MDSRRVFVSEVPEAAMVPGPRRPAVLLFGHAGFAYGHLSRCHKIARRLVELFPLDAYVVSSCPEYEVEEPHPAIHEVLLPAYRIGSPDFLPEGLPIVDRVSSLPHVPTDRFSAHRGRLLRAVAARLRPRAVLLEGFPFIRPLEAVGECGLTLAYLAESSPDTLRCGGFNGVAANLWMGEHASLIERVVGEQLDRLFVYVDPAERAGLFDRSPWLVRVADKVHVMGYVVGPPPEATVAGPEILATFGGGVDAFRKITLVVDAFVHLSASRPGVGLHVVTGGQLPEKGYREIVRRVDGRTDVRVSRLVPGLGRQLNRYRLVLSMGGYNACTELYEAATRGIVLPRFAPDFREQLEQARKFQAAGAIDWIVDADLIASELLAEVMARTLDAPPSPRTSVDIGGAEATARILAGDEGRHRRVS